MYLENNLSFQTDLCKEVKAYAFLFSSLMVAGDTLLPQSASVMSSTRRTDTPAKYISMSASSTLLSLRLYRSMMAVSKPIPFSRGTCSVTSPDVVVRLRS